MAPEALRHNPSRTVSTRLIRRSRRAPRPLEANAAVERQLLLGRVGDLQQMALEPGAGETRRQRALIALERRQEIADQNKLPGARQRLEGRQAVRCGGLARRARSAATSRVSATRPVIGAIPLPSKVSALAAAHQEARQRDEDQFGAVAFGRPSRAGDITGRGVVHRRRGVAPQPYALRRLPFGLADIKPLRLGAFAPIDARRRRRPADTGGIARRSRPGRRGAGRGRLAPRSGRPVRRRPGAAAAPPQSAPPGRAAAAARPGAATDARCAIGDHRSGIAI